MKLQPRKIAGVLTIPPSKSDGQRAVLCAGLAEGTSTISGLGPSDDEQQMLKNVEALGAKIHAEESRVIVQGTKGFPKKLDINLGESGLGFRLMAGQFAVRGGDFKIDAKGSLLKRPMHFYADTFSGTGLHVQGAFPPVEMTGYSTKSVFEIDGSQGSQFLSGLLMALPTQPRDSLLKVNHLKSVPYVKMTVNTLSHFGVQIESNAEFSEIKIIGNQLFQPTDYVIEGDWSSASCWLVLSALGQPISVSGLSMQSLQADKAILDAFLAANCKVEFGTNGISVDGSNRQTFDFDVNDCPDLFPALAALAAKTPGVSKIYGLNRLAIKESDRGKALQKEFQKIGVQVELDYSKDVMLVHGVSSIKGAAVHAHNDHRIAMCLGVLSTLAEGSMDLSGADSVSKSYPEFWRHLEHLSA